MKQEQQYNGWLVSNNIVKRSVAIWGHFMLGYIIVVVSVVVPVMIITAILSI